MEMRNMQTMLGSFDLGEPVAPQMNVFCQYGGPAFFIQ